MIARLIARVMSPRVLPGVAAIFFLALAIVPEAKWRLRDPGASAAASADLQTLLELAVYGAVGAWVLWHVLRGWVERRYRLGMMGPAVLMLVLATIVVVSSGMTAGSVRSVTRSAEYAVMTMLVVLVWWETYGSDSFLESFWRVVRRGFVVFAVFATLATAIVPGFGSTPDDFGVRRYGWLQIHPIVTAGMIGLTLIVILGAYLGLPDRLLRQTPVRIGVTGLSVVLLGLLLLTKSRGATVATMAALLVLVLMTPRRRPQRFAFLAVVAVAGLALIYFTADSGAAQLTTFVNRGQTTEQLLSLSQRTKLFEIGMQYFSENPIFGKGYMIPGTLLRTHFFWAGHAHNVALEIAMGMGLIGLAAFLALVLTIARGLWLGRRSAIGRATGLQAEGGALLVMILVQGVISDGFGGPVGWEVATLVLAVLIADVGALWRRRPLEVAVEPAAQGREPPMGSASRAGSSLQPALEPARSGFIDVNTASMAELMTLPRIGRRIAARIVAYRTIVGPFTSVDDLLAVKGIGTRVLIRIRPLVTVSAPGRRPSGPSRW